MQGTGTVAIDGPRFQDFLRSRKGVSQGFCCWVAQLGYRYIWIYRCVYIGIIFLLKEKHMYVMLYRFNKYIMYTYTLRSF